MREINLPEVEELYEVRVAIESFGVMLATERGRGADWRALARRWVRIPDPLPSPAAMLELDEGFRLTIAGTFCGTLGPARIPWRGIGF